MNSSNHSNYFLSGGGEMGELTRSFNWSQTSLGNPDQWPHSLKTTLGIILHSSFPMFLFWGEDLICFYNDAYRPSLGSNGKHPALGKKAFDVWPDIWDFIGPLIKKVLETNEAVWYEDQLLPIYRNGRMEDVYWTFSYSPAYGDDGNVSGVFVTCTETTTKVNNQKKLEESELKFRELIQEMPLSTCVLKGKELIADVVNDMAIQTWGKGSDILGKPLAEILPELKDQVYLQILQQVFTTGIPYVGESESFTIIEEGVSKSYVKKIIYKPLRDTFGNIHSILGIGMDIAEKMEEQLTLKRNLRQLVSYFEQTPVAIATIDKENLTFRLVNPFYAELVGRRAEDIVNKPLLDALPELKGQGFDDLLKNVIHTGEAYIASEVHVELLRKGKLETVYVNLTYQPQYDTDDHVSGILVVATDVTQQVVSRKAVEESEQQILSIIENSPFPIGVYVGREMRIHFANQNIIDVWGKGNDVIGKLYSEILPELDNQQIFEQLDAVYTTGIPFHAKNQRVDLVVSNKLQSFYFNYSFTPLLDATGKIYGVMNTAAEVTDLNLAKQRIEQSEQNLRNMILQAPVAMCILTGKDHIIEIANDFIIELWGKPKSDVINRPIFDALPDARGQGLESVMREVYEKGITYKADEMPVYLVRNGKHETIYQNFVYEPYRENCGKIIGVLVVTIDVTAQVLARFKIEEIVSERTSELAKANNNLQKSNAELAQFAYIASHDLQEPLRKISMYTQLLEGRIGNDLDHQSKSQLHKISTSAIRMNTLIKDVLAYSELIKETEEFVSVDLNQVIENTLIDFELLIEQKSVYVQYLPLPVVEAIPLQMAQLFGNLISNALKFSRSDIKPVITISTTILNTAEKQAMFLNLNTEYYKISISDNGIGLNPEHAEKIFNIFQRLHRKTDYEGTGIGLAMCKKIALNHNGNLNADGSSDKGAVFNVILPINQQFI